MTCNDCGVLEVADLRSEVARLGAKVSSLNSLLATALAERDAAVAQAEQMRGALTSIANTGGHSDYHRLVARAALKGKSE